MDLVLALALGIGLAAACGFRVFVPLLVMGIAGNAGYLTLAPSMQWLHSDIAVLTLGAATVLEIGGYYVPWIDNALDTAATPAAAIAGTLATASVITSMDPLMSWSVAAIAGGGTATTVQLATVATRATSTITTGGLGNPVVSTVEAGVATGLSLTAVILPIVAGAAVLITGSLAVIYVLRRRAAKRQLVQTLPATPC